MILSFSVYRLLSAVSFVHCPFWITFPATFVVCSRYHLFVAGRLTVESLAFVFLPRTAITLYITHALLKKACLGSCLMSAGSLAYHALRRKGRQGFTLLLSVIDHKEGKEGSKKQEQQKWFLIF